MTITTTPWFSDTFTADNGALSTNDPETGDANSWEGQPGSAEDMSVASNKATGDSSVSTGQSINTTSAPSPNYYVEGTVNHGDLTAPGPGFFARFKDGTPKDRYIFYWDTTGNGMVLSTQKSDTVTELQKVTTSLSESTDYTMRLTTFGQGGLVGSMGGRVHVRHVDDATPITAANGLGLRSRSHGTIDDLTAVEHSIGSLTQFTSDGVWTWFTSPEAVTYNGATYAGFTKRDGSVAVAKLVHSTGAVTETELSSGLNSGERDDHNNASIYITPTGFVVCFYCGHNDTGNVMRYRRSSSAEDISSFATEATFAVTTPSYSNPYVLGDYLYVFTRANAQDWVYERYSNKEVTGGSWLGAAVTWLEEPAAGTDRPYPVFRPHPTNANRLDVLTNDISVSEGQSSVYGMYILDTAGTVTFHNNAGTDLGSVPISSDAGSLVYDGSTERSFVWDITHDDSGDPWAIWYVVPSNTYTWADVGSTGMLAEIEFYFARWNGSAWTTPVLLAQCGPGLTDVSTRYGSGFCFDSEDHTKIYGSVPDADHVRRIYEFTTSDTGATWNKAATAINPNGIVDQCRPVSPLNHGDEMPVLWWEGVYSDFEFGDVGDGYDTQIVGGPLSAASVSAASTNRASIATLRRRMRRGKRG